MKSKRILKIILLSFITCLTPLLLLIGISMITYGRNFPLVKGYYWKGYIAQKNGNLTDAIEDYNEVSKLDENYPTAYISRGSAYFDLKKYNKAIDNYTTAIKLSPENEEPYAYRARAYYEIDSLKKSKEDFDKAIILNKDFAHAYSNRALLRYTKLNDYSGGCEDLKKAAELGDKDAENHLKEGFCE